ncbi:phage tail tape measure protein [Lactobacillus crispatus]|uniref:phage tail tape measure protein n=1 Tax=Lactobacillus crispatus TaxID=47770 RepID=UPI0021A2974F|nr:phage tail tape measure protein [Lactobacillus crispatus]MCT3539947.1 phage tail tape measure protein [Lactobacillus crispatus]
MAGEDYDIRAVLSAVDNGFTAGLDAAAAKAQAFADGSTLSMKSIGTGMTVAGAAVTAMGVKSITSFGQFEASLNKAAVVAGGTAKDIGQLDDLANKMGADLPLSAQDSADAMIEMARNGAGIKDIKEQFPAIAQAATAAGADIKATAGVVQESMNIWGKSLESPQQAAAILVQTANASNASIEDMQQALATIGGTATNANMSMQVTSEAIGLLTNRGFSAAQASIDLNHAIIQMVSPSKAAKNAMTELGISFVDSQSKMKQFPVILQELNKAMANLKPDEKAQKLKAMFGTAGMQAILPLLDSVKNKSNDAKVSWDAYAKEQEKAAGSTKKATATLKDQANEMQKNIGSSIEQLGGNWESLRNKSMKSAQAINGATIQNANRMLQWATDSNSATAQFIRGFIGLSPAIGAATTSVGMFLRNARTIAGTISGGITGISNFIKVGTGIVQVASGTKTAAEAFEVLSKSSKLATIAQWAFNSAILANPITWIVVGIAAVVATFALFFTQTKTGRAIWASFVSWLKGLWQGLVQVATTVWNGLVTVFKTVYNLSMAVWRPIVSFFRVLWQGIVIVTRTVWNVMRAYISTVFKNIQTVIRTGMTIIRTIFNAGWRILTTVVSTVWKMITTIVSGAINAVAGIIRAITAAIRGNWSGAWNAIKGIVQTVWDTIKSVVQTGINAVQSIVTTVMNAVKGVFSSVWNAIRDVFNNGVQFIKQVMHIDLFAQGQAIMNSLLKGLQDIWNNVKNFVGGIGNWIKEHKGPLSYDEQLLIPAGQAIMGGLFNGLNNGFDNVQDLVSSIAQSVASNVTDVMDNANSLLSDSRLELPEVSSQKFNDSLNNLNSQLQTNIMGQISINNNSTMARTNQLLERIANKDNTMVLDTGKVVAETTGQYNNSLGEQVARRDRWS